MFSRDDLRRGAARMREDGDIAFTDEDYGHLGPEDGLVMLRELEQRILGGRADVAETESSLAPVLAD
ncbi:hypothetical protein D9M70_490150 [compost metagenome]